MEIDFLAGVGLQETVVAFGEHARDAADQRRFMLLRLAIETTHVVLQPAANRVKSVPYRDVQVLMSVIQPRLSVRHDRATGHGQIDPHMINPAVLVVPIDRFQHHPAGSDAIRKSLKLFGPVPHLSLGGR